MNALFLTLIYYISFVLHIDQLRSHDLKFKVTREDTIVLGNRKVIYQNISFENFGRLSVKSFKQTILKSTVRKSKGVIKLPLNNGRFVRFNDVSNTETNDISYTFEGTLASRFYILISRHYDDGETLLVDKFNGNITRLWGDPAISPDGKHLLSWSAYLDYDMMPTGIQFYEMKAGKFKLEKEFKTSDWEPVSIAWIDNNKFIVCKLIPSYISKNNKDIKSYLKFTFN